MEVEVNVELPGQQVPHAQPAAQAAVDQLLQGGAVAQVDRLAAVRAYDLRVDFDRHRHQEAVLVLVDAQLDLLDRAHLDAEKDHRRADLQALRGAFEIQHVLAPLAEPDAAGQQQDGDDGQRDRAEHEGADQRRIGLFAHVAPRVRKWRTLGWPDSSATWGLPVAIMVWVSASR